MRERKQHSQRAQVHGMLQGRKRMRDQRNSRLGGLGKQSSAGSTEGLSLPSFLFSCTRVLRASSKHVL